MRQFGGAAIFLVGLETEEVSVRTYVPPAVLLPLLAFYDRSAGTSTEVHPKAVVGVVMGVALTLQKL